MLPLEWTKPGSTLKKEAWGRDDTASWTSLFTLALRSRRRFGDLPLGRIPWKTELWMLLMLLSISVITHPQQLKLNQTQSKFTCSSLSALFQNKQSFSKCSVKSGIPPKHSHTHTIESLFNKLQMSIVYLATQSWDWTEQGDITTQFNGCMNFIYQFQTDMQTIISRSASEKNLQVRASWLGAACSWWLGQ